jgi:hypothetical protein
MTLRIHLPRPLATIALCGETPEPGRIAGDVADVDCRRCLRAELARVRERLAFVVARQVALRGMGA